MKQLGIIRLVATAPTSQNQDLLRRISGITNKEVPVEALWCGPIFIRLSILFITDFIPGWRRFTDTCFPRKKSRYAVCCAPTSTKEIGVVTQQSVASVYVRKTAIRKKLGMDEKGDIVEYINNTQAT